MYNTLHPCNLTLHTFETLLSFKRVFCYGLNPAPKEQELQGDFGHYPIWDPHLRPLFSTILFVNYLLINQFIMKKMNLNFFTALLLTVGLVTSAQTVSGIVMSDDGPLLGATVVVKGISNGVSTDFDGNFSINAPADAILEVSFVGFSTLDVPVNGQDNLTITLATDNELDEVVVTDYGSQKKMEITAVVAIFREEEFSKGTINDASQLLQGKVAILSIYNKGGNPDDDALI